MKTLLKLIGGLLVGACLGFALVTFIIALINGESILTTYQTLASKFTPGIIAQILWLLFIGFTALIVNIVLHEGGHLVAGLLTGYRFVSFRFFNFTLISKDGHLRWRNFELAGTGGQCLLAPPNKPIDQIDTRWYNAGGVLANILITAVSLLLIWAFDLPQLLDELLGTMAVVGVLVALMNGIPMKLGGVANDGLNLFQLEKDIPSKQCFCNILDVNGRNQEGESYADMPERLFTLPQPIDWKNSIHVGAVLLAATRMTAMQQWEDAYHLLSEALDNKDSYMKLYQLEAEAMMTLVCIATGRDDEARQFYSKDVAQHVSLHASTQSDKLLVQQAVALALDNDRPAAEKKYHDLQAKRDKFVHQGDVAMSLDLMQWLLDNRQIQA